MADDDTTRDGLTCDPTDENLLSWLSAAIDPQLPIIDPHHHLWDRSV
jgi:hypothetical protein